MTFLNPYALWAAAVFLPALLVLYFLKLRRIERTVSSTFLWRRSLQDLQVNSLFQRLRRNLLLFLQLIFLALVVTALGAPACEGTEAGGRSVILLIDVSASMAATDTQPDHPNRLEAMKAEAAKVIRGIWTREDTNPRTGKRERPADELMIMTFSDRPEIVAPFTRDQNQLLEALKGLSVRQTGTDLPTALRVLASQAESRKNVPEVFIFTDGRVGDSAELSLAVDPDRLVVVLPKVGEKSDDNLGIAQFAVQRATTVGGRPVAIAQIVNSSKADVTTELAVSVNGRKLPLNIKPVTIRKRGSAGAASKSTPKKDAKKDEAGKGDAILDSAESADLPGSEVVKINLPDTGDDGKPLSGVVRLDILQPDSLDLDNHAWDVIPPARRPKCLLATAGPLDAERSPVVAALLALDFADFKVIAADDFRPALLENDSGGRPPYDMAVFDGFTPSGKLPPGRYLMLGALPPVRGIKPIGEVGDPLVKWNWVETGHRVLDHVKLDDVQVFRAIDWDLPDGGTLLAEGLAGTRAVPLLSEIVADGSTFLTVGFSVNPRVGGVVNTDWWIQPGFVVFMQNAVFHLGFAGSDENRRLTPGRPIDLPVNPEVPGGKVIDPDGKAYDVASQDGRLRFGDTARLGVWRVAPTPGKNSGGEKLFAVNLADMSESDIAPVPDGKVRINHEDAKTADRVEEKLLDAWRWFLYAALAFLALEWYVYNRKVWI
jgi:hypothetical protein